MLEQIRILSNLETDKEKLLQIVLVGQLNLKDWLRSPELRQLDQRVSIRYELKPLTREETSAYVAHRLTIAGGGASVSFSPKALDLVHRYTDGIPRLINLVCDRALLGGYSARVNRITPEMVGAAAIGLDLAMPRRSMFGWLRRGAAAFAAGAALTAAMSLAAAYTVITVQSRSVLAGTIDPRPVPIQSGAEIAAAVTEPSPASAQAPEGSSVAAPSAATPLATTTPSEATPSAATPSAAMPPEPAPSSPPLPAAEHPAAEQAGRYSVVVGSFRQNAEAGALVDQLRALGYRARAGRLESADRGTWHQVSVGPYADLEQARQDEARVRQMPGYADARLITQ